MVQHWSLIVLRAKRFWQSPEVTLYLRHIYNNNDVTAIAQSFGTQVWSLIFQIPTQFGNLPNYLSQIKDLTKSSNWIQQYHPQQSYSTQCIGLHLSICKDPLLNEFLIDFMCEYLSRPLKVRKRGCYNDRSGLLSVHYRYPPSPKLLMRNRVLNTFFLSPQLYYVSHF